MIERNIRTVMSSGNDTLAYGTRHSIVTCAVLFEGRDGHGGRDYRGRMGVLYVYGR